MLNGQTFYHQIMRKSIVAFGNMFSDIKIERQNKTNGEVAQTIEVPLAYAPKEKWLVRVDSDPNLNNNTYTVLPRMSFEITGMNYDPSRKVSRMNKIALNTDNRMKYQFSPVPYNIEISLYVLTKTQEDAMAIVEQILPIFTPEYNLSVMLVPEMGLSQDIPVVLNNVSVQDDYDGDFQTRRFVTYTLNFTMKVNMFGPIAGQSDIRKVISNVLQPNADINTAGYVAAVNPQDVVPTVTPYSINENWTETL
jgi:hypothetical protein